MPSKPTKSKKKEMEKDVFDLTVGSKDMFSLGLSLPTPKKKKQYKVKRIKCWIEIPDKHDGLISTPTLWLKKPPKIEIDNMREFGYEIYKAIIIYSL